MIALSDNRKESLLSLLDELTLENIDVGNYSSDLEPQASYDVHFNGKLYALRGYLELLQMSDLVGAVDEYLPVSGNAVEMLAFVSSRVSPEIRDALDACESIEMRHDFWEYIHPRIKSLARDRFSQEFRADAVSAAVREVNITVKRLVLEATGQEMDGAGLMTTAFSPNNPIIPLADLSSETGRNLQQGYMHLFQGAMIGIRNPKAHENFDTEYIKAIHLLFVASLLMTKIDERLDNSSGNGHDNLDPID